MDDMQPAASDVIPQCYCWYAADRVPQARHGSRGTRWCIRPNLLFFKIVQYLFNFGRHII